MGREFSGQPSGMDNLAEIEGWRLRICGNSVGTLWELCGMKLKAMNDGTVFDGFCGEWDRFCSTIPIGSMYGTYANIWGILMVNVTIYDHIWHTWILWVWRWRI